MLQIFGTEEGGWGKLLEMFARVAAAVAAAGKDQSSENLGPR